LTIRKRNVKEESEEPEEALNEDAANEEDDGF